VDNWRQVLDLNVLGLSICTKEAIESMNEKQVDGQIININRSVTLLQYIVIYSTQLT
jgi:NAD(P)-dependent dehydrogenase (short-subunit alcohol dehydrogenase family)